MKKNLQLTAIMVLVTMAACHAQTPEPKVIRLLPPLTEGGMPLMQALKNRQTTREFSEQELTEQQLSDLLWAAYGENRPGSGKRTVPSSMNRLEIDVYVFTSKGYFLYDGVKHTLTQLADKDLRALTGKQDFVAKAPVNMVFIADFSRMTKESDQEKEVTAASDAAFISQNVYLYCASEHLATGVRAYIDKPALSAAMKLRQDQHIILGQAVGHFVEK